jgi:hypothetical protein
VCCCRSLCQWCALSAMPLSLSPAAGRCSMCTRKPVACLSCCQWCMVGQLLCRHVICGTIRGSLPPVLPQAACCWVVASCCAAGCCMCPLFTPSACFQSMTMLFMAVHTCPAVVLSCNHNHHSASNVLARRCLHRARGHVRHMPCLLTPFVPACQFSTTAPQVTSSASVQQMSLHFKQARLQLARLRAALSCCGPPAA